MAKNLDFVIMEAAQSGLLSNDEAVSMFTVTTEGANWEARKEYGDRTRAAKALVKQYKKDVKTVKKAIRKLRNGNADEVLNMQRFKAYINQL